MEIEQLQQEINQLLERFNAYAVNFSEKQQISLLEVEDVLGKINALQEQLIVLRYLVNHKTKNKQQVIDATEIVANPIVEEPEIEVAIVEQVEELVKPITEVVIEETETVVVNEIVEEKKEAINENQLGSVAEQIQQTPIVRLADAFSLNDRYLYANELFNKDMSAFNQVVKSIDACANIDEAQTVFTKTGIQFNWDIEAQLVMDFMALIERRF